MTEFQGVDVDECFASLGEKFRKSNGDPSYRPNQKEAIMKALTALVEQDYDVFFIDASVGHGKSPDIAAIIKVINAMDYDAYFTTPQILLQDQLVEDFPFIPQIKGRSNFPCLDNPADNCSDAECQVNEKYAEECPFANLCTYTTQRNLCQSSPACGMNTAYMMTVRKEVFNTRYLYACDEAHSVPEAAIGYVAVSIREEDVGGFIPVFEKGFEAYLIWLEKMVYPKVKERYDQVKERVKSFGKGKRKAALGAMEEFKRLQQLIKKIELLSRDYTDNEEDWNYNIDSDTKGKKITFQPLTSGRFLKYVLWNRGEKIILSSGTITPEIYIKEGGLDNRAFNSKDCVIEIPSDFPSEKSPIYYKAIGKMTNDMKDITFPKIMKEINEVIKHRQDRKGIIHTFSYDLRPGIPYSTAITNALDPELRHLVCFQDRKNRKGSLEAWMNSDEPSVFLSTNMTEGLNLKDDLCRYQIYLKIGFPNTQDKRVAKRLELGHWIWYYMQAMEDLEQSSGRATRTKEDYSEMFIYDSSFATMFTKYGKYMKPWFKQRMKFINM